MLFLIILLYFLSTHTSTPLCLVIINRSFIPNDIPILSHSTCVFGTSWKQITIFLSCFITLAHTKHTFPREQTQYKKKVCMCILHSFELMEREDRQSVLTNLLVYFVLYKHIISGRYAPNAFRKFWTP